MRRTQPYFRNADGTTKHWPRIDGVYRTRNLQLMWMVVDTEQDYIILRIDARSPTAHPWIESRIPYSPTAFTTACQMAEGLARTASRSREGRTSASDAPGI